MVVESCTAAEGSHQPREVCGVQERNLWVRSSELDLEAGSARPELLVLKIHGRSRAREHFVLGHAAQKVMCLFFLLR